MEKLGIRWGFIHILCMFTLVFCNRKIQEKSDDLTLNSFIKEIGSFDSLGNKTGLWIGYYNNKTVAYKGNYLKGLKDSIWVYYNIDGDIDKIERFEIGRKNGLTKIYSKGNLYDEINYKNDVKDGKHTHYYTTSNKINFLQEYRNDTLHGEFKLFFENGKLKQHGAFKNGRNIGEWLTFSERGEIIERIFYE